MQAANLMSKRESRTGPPEDADWRSYRCPVCGHADDVDVPEDEALLIRCSHCETALEVERAAGASERVSVHVASEERDTGTE